MVGSSAWERQRKEVNAYNLFFSAMTARAEPSLIDHGFRLVGSFARVGRKHPANPDFVIYDGNTLLLAEVKSGNNINDRHIQQMQACDHIDIETAEDYLSDAQVSERMGLSGGVSAVESCIVYQDIDEAYVQTWSEESDDFKDNLMELLEHTTLLTQDYGGELRIIEGEFTESRTLQSILESGIRLPLNPPDEFMLTESMEKEILAVAITDVWGGRVVDQEDPIVVSREEVRSFFAPRYNVPPGNVGRVFEFLDEFGACSREDPNVIEFTDDNIQALLQIEEAVSRQRVEDYLQEEDQTTFDEFEAGDDS